MATAPYQLFNRSLCFGVSSQLSGPPGRDIQRHWYIRGRIATGTPINGRPWNKCQRYFWLPAVKVWEIVMFYVSFYGLLLNSNQYNRQRHWQFPCKDSFQERLERKWACCLASCRSSLFPAQEFVLMTVQVVTPTLSWDNFLPKVVKLQRKRTEGENCSVANLVLLTKLFQL